MMKRTTPLLLAATALLFLLASTPDRLPVADPVAALGALESTSRLSIHRSATELSISDLQSDRAVFTLTSEGLATLSADYERPEMGAQADVREITGPTGEVDLTLAETSRGAQIMVTRPGVLHFQRILPSHPQPASARDAGSATMARLWVSA